MILKKQLSLPNNLGKVIRSFPDSLKSINLLWERLFRSGKYSQPPIFTGVDVPGNSPQCQAVQKTLSLWKENSSKTYLESCIATNHRTAGISKVEMSDHNGQHLFCFQYVHMLMTQISVKCISIVIHRKIVNLLFWHLDRQEGFYFDMCIDRKQEMQRTVGKAWLQLCNHSCGIQSNPSKESFRKQ